MSDSHNAVQHKGYRRRTYLLDREFQLKYMLLLAVLGAGGMALFGVLAYRLRQDAGGLVWLTVGAVVGMGLVLGVFGLVFTHRVAGPVHVMNLYMAALAAGRYPRLRPLRKGDELQSFFERFGEAVDRIRQREAEEARALGQVLEAFGPLATTAQAREALQLVEELHGRKRQAIDETTPSGTFKSLA